MTFLRHITIISGVGVGGGSLVYGNTLPTPKTPFFTSGSWAGLEDWENDLMPFYETARRMLGVAPNPQITPADKVLQDVGKDLGVEEKVRLTDVAVFFGEQGKEVPDPYFKGEGPSRVGCTFCGGCMLGCRIGAKNTLDQNYLYLAEQLGSKVQPNTLVKAVRARSEGGYGIEVIKGQGWFGKKEQRFTADRVVLCGGVLGTIDLLLSMKKDPKGLPNLSPRTGDDVRTNSESIISVVAGSRDVDFSKGIAISSILHTDDHSHVEPCRFSSRSDFFRVLSLPWLSDVFRRPIKYLRTMFQWDISKATTSLLYMRSLEGKMIFREGRFLGGIQSQLGSGAKPEAFIPEANEISRRFADRVDGFRHSLIPEMLLKTPSTAHILGGAVIGASPETGVINSRHEVFGYPGLLVADGSAVSSNPGVNPSLTITAMTERAMSFIPKKG